MSGRIIDTASDNPPPANGSGSDDPNKIRFTLDLVAAARSHLSFLRSLSGASLASSRRSIQRYEELWMPLLADSIDSSLILLPPIDVHWIWHCHCLNDPVGYRQYCTLRFGTVIDRPSIFDEENEEYAILRCQEIWEERYPSEPFDLEMDGYDEIMEEDEEICAAVEKHQSLVSYFSDTFVLEMVYLISAKQRYLNFLHLVRKYRNDGAKLVPASDVLLMWLTHKSFPVNYAKDFNAFGDIDKKIIGFGDQASERELDETRRIWDEAFDEPYERPGASFDPMNSPSRVFFNWPASDADADANRAYKSLQPRFLMEVCIYIKGKLDEKELKGRSKKFLRLRTARCYKSLKLDKPFSDLPSSSWKKTWHLYCEFNTKGIILETREQGTNCFINSKLIKTTVFSYNDLLRITSFTLVRELEMELRALASITPPVQAPYLLKCVPDRVTDDRGAMISEVILRMNRYRPQEGRWLTRTVLDHGGKECFVVQIRVGSGIWRRGAENPVLVKWEDRIIKIQEGSWSYVASSVGYAPQNVVGTAMPNRENSEDVVVWTFSTGDFLKIEWDHGPNFHIWNSNSTDTVRLLRGRKSQYQLITDKPSTNATKQDEDHYVTLIRYSPENPDGKATALINWKLLAVEFLPDEDAVLILLICMSIARTVSEFKKEDVANLLVRRRVREVKAGLRDWGSIMVPDTGAGPHLKPWYWNAEEVLAPEGGRDGGEIGYKYYLADGKDVLYKQCIIP